jgi:ribose 5-phosphate isomerase B
MAGPMPETVAVAADHAGYDLKCVLVPQLRGLGFEVLDLGTHSPDSVDYPDFADMLATALRDGRAQRGLLACGSGIGISIAANRFRHIRAALCHDGLTARLARQHNDANVLVLGGRLIGADTAKDCVEIFFTTAHDGGVRHARRIAKLA